MVLIDSLPRLQGVLPVDAAATVEAILRASGTVRPAAIDVMRKPWLHRMYARIERWLGRGQLL